MGRAQQLLAAAEQLRGMWLALEDAYPVGELATATGTDLQRLLIVHAAIASLPTSMMALRQAAAQEVASGQPT
jgi:hypothetical protein